MATFPFVERGMTIDCGVERALETLDEEYLGQPCQGKNGFSLAKLRARPFAKGDTQRLRMLACMREQDRASSYLSWLKSERLCMRHGKKNTGRMSTHHGTNRSG
jgi:hypothetical protein